MSAEQRVRERAKILTYEPGSEANKQRKLALSPDYRSYSHALPASLIIDSQKAAKMRGSFLIVPVLLLVVQLASQQVSAEPMTVQGVLHAMRSANMKDREKAFDEASKLLASPDTAASDIERLRLGLIQLLTAENASNNIPDEEMAKLAAAASCGNGTDNCEGSEEDDESGGTT